MGIKPDQWIHRNIAHGLIHPCLPSQLNGISHGVSSYGYDARLDSEVRMFCNAFGVIDPKNFNEDLLTSLPIEVGVNDKYVILPPYGFALATTIETFSIPSNCVGIVTNKSTYNRCGLVMGVAILEPEWVGQITLELSNKTPLPLRLYIGEGICQVVFLEASEDDQCRQTYADKKGKYQGQTGVTTAKVK